MTSPGVTCGFFMHQCSSPCACIFNLNVFVAPLAVSDSHKYNMKKLRVDSMSEGTSLHYEQAAHTTAPFCGCTAGASSSASVSAGCARSSLHLVHISALSTCRVGLTEDPPPSCSPQMCVSHRLQKGAESCVMSF